MTLDLKVLIVGGGFAGVIFGILLERAGIDYEILERSPEIRQYGSGIALGANVIMLLEQLGILADLRAVSKPYRIISILREDLTPVGIINYSRTETRHGHPATIMSRHELLQVCLNRIPPEKIQLGKRVLSMQQNNEGVLVRCSDGSVYHGDILAGCDGAWSNVRQNIFRDLSNKGELPKSDNEPMAVNHTSLVGVAGPLDPEVFKECQESDSVFRFVIGKDKPFSWTLATLPGNRISWMVMQRLETSEVRNEIAFKNSGWGPEAAQEMCKEVRDFVCPFGPPGTTMNDMIEATPTDRISKVMLEEKSFETWYSGRTVLLGDACHKVSPAAGQGATQAILDAVALANLLHELPSTSYRDISQAFKTYQAERGHHGKAAVQGSKQFAKVFRDEGIIANMVRKSFLNFMSFAQDSIENKILYERPQATYLPFVVDRGIIRPKPQFQSLRMVTADNPVTI